VAGLKPLSSVPYTLSFGKTRAPDAVATDLQVKEDEPNCNVEITTGKFGVRLHIIQNATPALRVRPKT
jgi:hypothetical protein